MPHDREDLLRDARALTPRVKLRLQADGRDAIVIAGFRGEALSLYFGEDPVYHFNAQGQLRRAFVDGRLIKAERGRLVQLERQRGMTATLLVRHELDAAAENRQFDELHVRLASLRSALVAGAYTVDGQIPANGDAMPKLERLLAEHREIVAALSPRVQ